MSSLSQAIEQLYLAFADVPRPRTIEGCPCCADGKHLDKLLAKPLRELTAADLSSYAFSALWTVGDVADYLYFLPRILEISATDDTSWPDIEVTAGKIHRCTPESWPTQRRESLRQLLSTVVSDVIATRQFYRLDDWICAIGRIGLPVALYLAEIAQVPEAVLAYFEDNAKDLPQGRLSNAFWELPNPAHDEIVAWFYSEPIRRIPFEAYGYNLPRRN